MKEQTAFELQRPTKLFNLLVLTILPMMVGHPLFSQSTIKFNPGGILDSTVGWKLWRQLQLSTRGPQCLNDCNFLLVVLPLYLPQFTFPNVPGMAGEQPYCPSQYPQ